MLLLPFGLPFNSLWNWSILSKGLALQSTSVLWVLSPPVDDTAVGSCQQKPLKTEHKSHRFSSRHHLMVEQSGAVYLSINKQTHLKQRNKNELFPGCPWCQALAGKSVCDFADNRLLLQLCLCLVAGVSEEQTNLGYRLAMQAQPPGKGGSVTTCNFSSIVSQEKTFCKTFGWRCEYVQLIDLSIRGSLVKQVGLKGT